MDDLRARFNQRSGDRVARRGRRRARARVLEAPRHQPGHHRQAPARAERQRGGQHHRRREGPRRASSSTTWSTRPGTLCARGPGREGTGGARRSTPCASARRAVAARPIERITASPIEELLITDTIAPRPEVRACPKVKVLCVARTAWARRSSASTTATRSARCSSEQSARKEPGHGIRKGQRRGQAQPSGKGGAHKVRAAGRSRASSTAASASPISVTFDEKELLISRSTRRSAATPCC